MKRDSVKIKKIMALVLLFVVVFYFCSTYFFIGNFNVVSFSKKLTMLFSTSQGITVNRDYIESNQKITQSEPNGVGAISYDYSLDFDSFPKNVISASVEFDKEKNSVGDISIVVKKGETSTKFEVSDTTISDCTRIILLGENDITGLSLVSRYDAYGGAAINNDEIVSAVSIKFNITEDIVFLKQQLARAFLRGITLTGLCFLIGVFIVKSKADQKLFNGQFNIEKTFLFTTIIVGMIFSFLFPVLQIPDEQAHIKMAYESLGWDSVIENFPADFADTARIIRNYNQKVDISNYFNMQQNTPLPDGFALPTIMILRHAPQAIGLFLASILRIPLWFGLAFAEFSATIVYALMGYCTIKCMPFKKELMTVILLLPICLQQATSFSYDSFLLAAYFLYFAYVLHLKFTKEKITLMDAGIIMVLLAIVAIIKIPYIFAAVMLLIIPVKKIELNFGLFKLKGEHILKHKIWFVAGTVILTSVIVVVAYKMLINMSAGRIFVAASYNISGALKLILGTIKEYGWLMIVQLTGSFGWFDTPVSLMFTVFVVLNVFFFAFFDFKNSQQKPYKNNPFKFWEFIVFLFIAVFITLITVLSMFGWTIKAYGIDFEALSLLEISQYMDSIPYIGGLQGRYFIPILPFALFPWYFPKATKQLQKVNHTTYLCGYHIVVFVYVATVLLNRYWL